MQRIIAVVAAVTFVIAGAGPSPAQEQRPAPGGTGSGGMGGHTGGMMGGHMGGMMGMPGGGMRGMRGGDHLEHLMVHDPKAAARLMRFRADMLRAMGEVLQRHAAELEKAQ
ncbi:MAG: hypothetical protein ACREMB_14635 [Candidatus Rokuibacteriota bacterium]